MSTQEIISIVKIQDKTDIYESVRSGFQLIGKPSLHSNDIVAIKPNLCCIKGPETGATTDLRVVEAIIRYLQEEFQIANISIVESDGTQLLADMAFKLLGYERLSKKYNVKLVNLSKDICVEKSYENNAFLKKVKIPQVLEKATCLISVPKIQIHTLCSFGGTMKNQYGCNPHAKKTSYHKNLHDSVVDLTFAFKPQLIVVDGIVGMEGRGPVGGLPVKMNTLIFGRDALAVDHLIARLIGVNPDKVKYIVDAKKRGLGTTDYRIVGASIEEVQKRFNNPPLRNNLYGLFSLRS
jgi:uncharacterized protein (DUF362 family)